MRLNMIGIDPGIVDTGAVSISLDFRSLAIDITTQLWTGVSRRDGFAITVNDGFLDEIAAFTQHDGSEEDVTLVGIEGYRQRGFDQKQDQNLVYLVQALKDTIPSATIVDNTGIKKIVKEGLLRLLHSTRFQSGGNHADLKSAARVAVRLAIKDDMGNQLLSDFVRSKVLREAPWTLRSTTTL